MYLKKMLYTIYNPYERDEMLKVSKKISSEYSKKNRFFILCDMMMSNLIYGATSEDYFDLLFYKRKHKLRKTVFTTNYELKLFDIINPKEYRKYFWDKVLFDTTFSEFIHRKWMSIDNWDGNVCNELMSTNDKVVLKGRTGNCGKQVCVYHIKPEDTSESIYKYMKENNYALLEEAIVNHPVIAKLNKSSLNTIRIVTFRKDNKINIVFAGIRIGAEGKEVDNLSQGGSVARIDIETGKISSPFFSSSTKKVFSTHSDFEIIGFQIPYWNELIEYTLKIADKIPQIQSVAWDIAVTEDGPDIIEGNNSYGCNIMQLYDDETKPCLKPKIVEILGDIADF